jgi:hypothetical protein
MLAWLLWFSLLCSDLVLTFERSAFRVQKAVVCLHSSVFESALTHGVTAAAEKKGKQQVTIALRLRMLARLAVAV